MSTTNDSRLTTTDYSASRPLGTAFAKSGTARRIHPPQADRFLPLLTEMKTPVQNSRGRLIYTGQIARSTFNAWAQSTDGHALLDQIGSELRFALLGRNAAARRRVWRQLRRAIGAAPLATVLQGEVDASLQRLDPIVYAHDLPRVTVDLRRLVVVPRLFVNAEAYRGISAGLRNEPLFTTPEAVSLSEWFILTIIDAIQAAVVRERPSVLRPLQAAGSWTIVGVNQQYEWRVPFEGPPWPGHYYAMELTAEPITRAVRKAVEKSIGSLEQSLPSLPRNRRSEIIRQATLSLDHHFGRDRRRAASF
jgi:hypothetical protein